MIINNAIMEWEIINTKLKLTRMGNPYISLECKNIFNDNLTTFIAIGEHISSFRNLFNQLKIDILNTWPISEEYVTELLNGKKFLGKIRKDNYRDKIIYDIRPIEVKE